MTIISLSPCTSKLPTVHLCKYCHSIVSLEFKYFAGCFNCSKISSKHQAITFIVMGA